MTYGLLFVIGWLLFAVVGGSGLFLATNGRLRGNRRTAIILTVIAAVVLIGIAYVVPS